MGVGRGVVEDGGDGPGEHAGEGGGGAGDGLVAEEGRGEDDDVVQRHGRGGGGGAGLGGEADGEDVAGDAVEGDGRVAAHLLLESAARRRGAVLGATGCPNAIMACQNTITFSWEVRCGDS